jgi:hypothetical protein
MLSEKTEILSKELLQQSNGNNKKITSIKIINTSWGLIDIGEIAEQALTIYRTGKIKHQIYNRASDKPVNEYEYKINKADMNSFFNYLTDNVNIQEWKEDYSIEVCDGWCWELKIRYSDNTIKKVIGTVEKPPKGDQIEEYILKLTRFKVKPWIF